MALAQADQVIGRIRALHAGLEIERVIVAVRGDAIQGRTLAAFGGKALFCKELEAALLSGSIDAAVHSCKDVATFAPPQLTFAAVLPRDDCRDAFISRDGSNFADIPTGARIGTASVRRTAQLLALRPDLQIVPMRGNANTRLAKLDMGLVDALVLGAAGMARIGLSERITEIFPVNRLMPAPTQAAIVVQARRNRPALLDILSALDDPESRSAVEAERGFLEALGADCNSPLAALATIEACQLTLRGQALSIDGKVIYDAVESGNVAQARQIGLQVGERMKKMAGAAFFALPNSSLPAL